MLPSRTCLSAAWALFASSAKVDRIRNSWQKVSFSPSMPNSFNQYSSFEVWNVWAQVSSCGAGAGWIAGCRPGLTLRCTPQMDRPDCKARWGKNQTQNWTTYIHKSCTKLFSKYLFTSGKFRDPPQSKFQLWLFISRDVHLNCISRSSPPSVSHR